MVAMTGLGFRHQRIALGISGRALAIQLGLAPSTVSLLESRGREMRSETAIRYLTALNVCVARRREKSLAAARQITEIGLEIAKASGGR